MHKGCKIDSWEEFEVELSELVDEYDDGNILICTHHPIHTQGSHGGFFPIKEHLFQPYSHDGKSGSTGLGLFVSRDLARAMDGDLRYERRDGWTVFSLELRAS